jgi:hypothetical protein
VSEFGAALEAAERVQLIADLRAAREVLVARGRCRRNLVDQRGERVCAMGAVGVATVDGFLSMRLLRQTVELNEPRPVRVRMALEQHLFDELYVFSDDARTTDQDVLNLFDKTLADLGGAV